MRGPAQLAVDVFAALEHQGAANMLNERCLCSPGWLHTLDKMDITYTVERGNGKGPRGAKVFQWEDSPKIRRLTQNVVEEVLGGVYSSRRGISGWREALLRIRPDVAIFDIESDVDRTLDGALVAHEAAKDHPALVVGLYSSKKNIAELAGDLPYCSKMEGPRALGPWIEGLTKTRARMLELAVRSTDYELLRRTAEVWAPQLGQEVARCGPTS